MDETGTDDAVQQSDTICAVKVDFYPDLRLKPSGWTLDENNGGVGGLRC